MMFTTELRLTGVMAVLMVGGVAAQSTISSSSPTPTGSVMTHVIQVGDAQGTLKFFPEKVKANKGDLIQFQFFPKVNVSSISFHGHS